MPNNPVCRIAVNAAATVADCRVCGAGNSNPINGISILSWAQPSSVFSLDYMVVASVENAGYIEMEGKKRYVIIFIKQS